MNKPTKKEFGWETWCGWANGNLNEYLKELKRWENRPRKANAGRKRTREIDPSWLPFLDKFQPVPGKSQGAFCRWADLNRGTFSAMQCKVIEPMIAAYINAWVESWDKPEIDFPICCDLCQKELNTKNELIVSRDMICINSTFQLLEQNLCHECHHLIVHDEFGIPKEFQSEYERLMEKND